MDNKNFLLAVVLSIAFLGLWSLFVVPHFTPPTPPARASSSTSSIASSYKSEASQSPTSSVSKESSGSSIPGTDSILEGPQSKVVLSSKGGGIVHWMLRLKGQEIDLVSSPNENTPLPLSSFDDLSYTVKIQNNQAIMQTHLPTGVLFTKTLSLRPQGYLQDLTFRFDNPTNKTVEIKDWRWGWGPGLGTTPSEQKDNARTTRAISMGKISAHKLKPGDYPDIERWAAIDNRYFLVAFIPNGVSHPSVAVEGKQGQTQLIIHEDITIPAKASSTIPYQLYVGPKGYTQLGHYGLGLENAVDFGVFSALGKLILKAIYYLKEITGNYGWAIIILTVFLQVLVMPLTIKSFKATIAMKTLQPQIAALQKAYKNDPKRLNIEMMNIYKKSGTNPFGGCLPMLIQLPIFWALFTTLRNAYELRGAPFILWIHDLSVADPLHILPIAMGIAMFFQQRMAGTVADPTQKQMMMIMPIMFTVMFFNFPSGLVLYWFVNNLLTMSFQLIYKRYTENLEPKAAIVH